MNARVDNKPLELLLMYTIFHVGAYLTLTTAFMAATVLWKFDSWLIRWAVFFFLIAGACGGLIAANVAENGDDAATFFQPEYRLNLLGLKWFPLRVLTTVEHLAFWVGILPITIVYLVIGGVQFKGP